MKRIWGTGYEEAVISGGKLESEGVSVMMVNIYSVAAFYSLVFTQPI